MTIADNVFVMRPGFKQELIRTKLLNRQLQPFLKEIGIEIPSDARIENLSVFQRVVIELLRAVVAGRQSIDRVGRNRCVDQLQRTETAS